MKKEFVPYNEALELNELGFDEPCFGCYEEIEKRDYKLILEVTISIGLSTLNGIRNYNQEDRVAAPTYSQAFRWFREKYKLHSTITSISQESWQWHITKPGESLGKLYDEDFYTYEEAELACLKKLIEIVKK